MSRLGSLFDGNPILRVALAVPVLIMFVFSFFNLSAPLDQQRAIGALDVGLVNADEGVGPMVLSENLTGAMGAALPFTLVSLSDEDAGRAALDAGTISALVLIPADFTQAATTGGPISLRVIGTQHLSAVESQFGAMLGGQLQAGVSAALAQALAPLGRTPPAVIVESEMLHSAANATTLMAAPIMVFAIWVAGLAGSAALFAATRALAVSRGAATVAWLRTLPPAAVTGLATLLLALTVAWLTGQWGGFFALWLLSWLAAYAVTVLFGGLFASIGLWALILIVPTVFYQATLSGAQAPVAAAPDWLAWFGEALPFSALPEALRSVLIGGPVGPLVPVASLTALIGVALIFAGTYLWAGRNRAASPELHA